jgi:hypothetical protein
MKSGNVLLKTFAAVVLCLLIWLVYSSSIVAHPELESLLSTCFAFVIGVVVGMITWKNTPLEGCTAALITLPTVMAISRLLTNTLDVMNFMLNLFIYLPLTFVAFFATWGFRQPYGLVR